MTDNLGTCSCRRLLWLISLLVAFLAAGTVAAEEKVMHGDAWAFGQSTSRADTLWQRGVGAKDITKRAIPKHPNQKDRAVDTSAAIDRALNEAEKGKVKGSVGMSMADDSTFFKARPNGQQVDEFMPRDKRHVVRAFADVKAGEDLDISVGPELILRDETKGDEAAHEKQPDSSLGVGMRFKFDF